MNGTIYDYMDWRGDLELKQSPLNLVDNVILPDSSIIGTLLDSHARTLVISSRVSGFGQHDAFTWEVLGNRFVESERSPSGRFYDEFLQRWIGSMTDRQRHIFTDALFDLIEAGGDSLNELKAEPMRAALEMIKASVKMDEAARAELPEILKQLAASGAETLKGVLQ
ncbi:MAG: DUF2974 domain-containing protein [Lachnospiraceae bacterium]|nr:DUF2974 domain-containing protein [Lachnospiraceae bacterium]